MTKPSRYPSLENPGFAQRPNEVSQGNLYLLRRDGFTEFSAQGWRRGGGEDVQKDREKELREGTFGMTPPEQGNKEGFRPL